MRKAHLRYRLIKEYPGSEKLGTTFSFGHEGWLQAGVVMEDRIQFNTEWTPEYFEKWVGEYYELVK